MLYIENIVNQSEVKTFLLQKYQETILLSFLQKQQEDVTECVECPW